MDYLAMVIMLQIAFCPRKAPRRTPPAHCPLTGKVVPLAHRRSPTQTICLFATTTSGLSLSQQ